LWSTFVGFCVLPFASKKLLLLSAFVATGWADGSGTVLPLPATRSLSLHFAGFSALVYYYIICACFLPPTLPIHPPRPLRRGRVPVAASSLSFAGFPSIIGCRAHTAFPRCSRPASVRRVVVAVVAPLGTAAAASSVLPRSVRSVCCFCFLSVLLDPVYFDLFRSELQWIAPFSDEVILFCCCTGLCSVCGNPGVWIRLFVHWFLGIIPFIFFVIVFRFGCALALCYNCLPIHSVSFVCRVLSRRWFLTVICVFFVVRLGRLPLPLFYMCLCV
jgi:hypothetical protein